LKVLIIEDDPNVVEAFSLCFQLRWPEVTLASAAEGGRGIDVLKTNSFDIIILDINLPDIDGFEVLKRIRLFSNVPIVIVTVRGAEDDQARGLEMGADDYIVKPFRPRDFLARVNTVMRRTRISGPTVEQSSLVRGKLMLNLTTNDMQLGEESAKLTPTECRVLYMLMNNADCTVSTKQVLQDVWGKEHVSSDPVRTIIRRLRDKLSDYPSKIILSERGKGYRFVTPV